MTKLIGSVMAGGFIPTPASASMGLLMFLNGNLMATKLVDGTAFDQGGGSYGIGEKFDSCTANAVEPTELLDTKPRLWFQRFYREPAADCYLVDTHVMLGHTTISRHTFVNFENATNPEELGLVHPIIDGKPALDKWCTYECSGFKAFEWTSLIESIGSIFAGAAVITKVAHMLTARLGWQLMTPHSSPAELVWECLGQRMPDIPEPLDPKTRDKMVKQIQNVYVRRPGSALLAAIQFLGIVRLAFVIAPYVTIDGYNTVNYFTMLIMIVSVLCSLLIRSWSPFQCRSVIFTKNMWSEGIDYFNLFNPTTKQFERTKINLYEWIHTPHTKRMEALLQYCRAIGMDELEELYNEEGYIPELNAQMKAAGIVEEEPLETIRNSGSR